jgi:hypothetical protein
MANRFADAAKADLVRPLQPPSGGFFTPIEKNIRIWLDNVIRIWIITPHALHIAANGG